MESYIIRIYRRDKDSRRVLVGLVEEVGVVEKKAFETSDDLWNILNAPSAPVHSHAAQERPTAAKKRMKLR